MKRLTLLLAAALLAGQATAQLLRARAQEDFTITVEEVDAPLPVEWRGGNAFEQLPGYPKSLPATSPFRNFRNVTLADLNGDGYDEILWPAGDKLLAYTKDGLLWEKTLSAEAVFPPAVADIDNDGQLEVVQSVFGVIGPPLLYALESDGSDIPGWPVSLGDNRIFLSPALSDLDGDGTMEAIACTAGSGARFVYILKNDGAPFNDNWPLELDANPAVTPSIGDLDGDGAKDIVVHSSQARYALQQDGQLVDGFPIPTGPETTHSYQSPILIDLDEDGGLEIVAASHGDAPEFFVSDNRGDYRPGWPKPESAWTYTTPTVVELDGEPVIFMSGRLGDDPGDMLYAWNADGSLREGFPINKMGGNEGIISIADVDGDDAFEVIFGSELFATDGPGFIHAYELDGSGEVEGFPLRPYGINHMNGAALSDINGDGMMDLIAVSYTQFTDADSLYLNAYNLNVPYSPERVLWSTYKGSNTHDGLLTPQMVSATTLAPLSVSDCKASPNPAQHETLLSFTLQQPTQAAIYITDALGRRQQLLPPRYYPTGEHQARIPLNNTPPGLYWISVADEEKIMGRTPVLVR